MGKGNKFKQDGAEVDTEADAPAAPVSIGSLFAPGTSGPAPLDPKYEGLKSYQLTERHFRDGRMFEPGECVTVLDEKPGRTWKAIVYSERYERITRETPLEVHATTGKPPTAAQLPVPTPVPLDAEPLERASDRSV